MSSAARVLMEQLDISAKSTRMIVPIILVTMEEHVLIKLEVMNASVDQVMLGLDVRVMSMNA